jgi:hypothetical protein
MGAQASLPANVRPRITSPHPQYHLHRGGFVGCVLLVVQFVDPFGVGEQGPRRISLGLGTM